MAGGLVALLGVVSLVRGPNRIMARAASLVAACIAGGTVVLLVRLIDTWRDLRAHDAMMVARIGPGLFVVLLGALIATAALLPAERR
jgi:hypothetical protein